MAAISRSVSTRIVTSGTTASPLALRQLRLLHPSRLRWRCSVLGWPGSTIVVEDNSKRNKSFSSTMDRSVQLKAADSKGCLRLFSIAELYCGFVLTQLPQPPFQVVIAQ